MLQHPFDFNRKVTKKCRYYFCWRDLIDRGRYPSKVIEFVRKNRYKSVLSNHENRFIKFFKDYKSSMGFDELKNKWNLWIFYNGGKEILKSYN